MEETMSPTELEHYLHDRIPLARAMEVVVDSVSDTEVVLAAPLAPNRNHRGTLFGGSAAAAATLAAWALLTVRLRDISISELLLIQRSNMRYNLPVTGHFRARSALASPESWERFIETLERRQRARITVSADLEQDGIKAVQFTGTFMAVSPRDGKH
jgi:thioesterase domain-containing protein